MKSSPGLLVIAITASIAACSARTPDAQSPDPWRALSPAIDENPAADIVEVRIEARASTKAYPGANAVPVWSYNGVVPGPLIDANVGDKVIVHFTNSLPEETTIHWHGVRVPAAMDGTPAMQTPVPPGGTFDYSFTLKDAGLFWFHPHVRTDVQVHKGLYGIIRVRGANEPQADQEGIVVLDDVTVLPNGTLAEYLDDDSKMLGRQGKTLLVNGLAAPTFVARAGALVRLRVVNVANGRFFNLAMPGSKWRVIGTDGGFLPKPYDADHLLVAPGERYDVVFVASGAPGSEATLTDDPYERGHSTGKDPPLPVATLRINDEPPLSGRTLPAAFPDIERLPNGAVDDPITLDEGIQNGELVFTLNGAVFPNVPMLDIPQNAVRRLQVENKSEMDHPFHIHGIFFQLLEKAGVPVAADALANKDTIIVPAKTTLKLVARFDAPGTWMYHCHILEHAEGGMMGEIRVR